MKNILITGLPGAGKTTLIRRLCEIFKEFNPSGFYTAEIEENGFRTGFETVNLNGDSKMFAHINLKSKNVVGKYKIDVKGFDKFLDSVFSRDKKSGLYFIDEIAKMECKSKKFSRVILELLNSDKLVVASIADSGTGLIADIKKRNDVKIIELTPYNQDLIIKELTLEIRDILLE